MVLFYKMWKKYNKTELTKNEMDLNNRKMKNHPSSPAYSSNPSSSYINQKLPSEQYNNIRAIFHGGYN